MDPRPPLPPRRNSKSNVKDGIKHIDVNHISDEDAKLLHEFFLEYEKNPAATIFLKGNAYPFKGYQIQFNEQLVRYKSNKDEYIYTVESNASLGSGGGGHVNRSPGKLVHANNQMSFIRPTDVKSPHPIILMTVADVRSVIINDLKDLSHNKVPILIKDEITQDIFIFGRKDNRWVLTPLDKTKFMNLQFPDKLNTRQENTLSFDGVMRSELHKGHTRKAKAIKTIGISNENKIENVINESEIGRATGRMGTKEPTFHFGQEGKVISATIVMDIEQEQNLEKIIESKKLSAAQRLELSINLLTALKEYHDKGFLHRDIKPANIMVDINNNMAVKLIDDGCGRKISDPDYKQKGTGLYMSPEMMVEYKIADIASDVYSMGRVLKHLWGEHEMLQDLITPNANQYGMAIKLDQMWNNPPKPTELTLDESLGNSVLRSQLASNLLQPMNTIHPENRMMLKEGIAALHNIQQNMKDYDQLSALLGDGRKGDTQAKSNDNFKSTDLQSYVSKLKPEFNKPHLIIKLYQQLFSLILKNEGQLYTNTGLIQKRYTDTQLKHLQIIKDAYRGYLKTLNVHGLHTDELRSLHDELISDQDKSKYPKNINNFNMDKSSRMFEKTTKSYTETHAVIKNIESEFLSRVRHSQEISQENLRPTKKVNK